ncbi:phage N-6-adenine-methyltransferase [Pasteurella multocida]
MEIQFNKDNYRTPRYVFNWLNKRFNFDLDACADSENKLCERYLFDDGEGGFLTYNPNNFDVPDYGYVFRPKSIFINPPYSTPLPFIEKAVWCARELGATVVMLLPADKSTKWYKFIEENATEVIDIIGGRINFLHPVSGEEVKGNNKGSMVAVFDPTMQGFITRSVSLDFVKQVGCYGN